MNKNNFSSVFSLLWSHFDSQVGVSTAVGFTSASFLIISYLMLACSRSKLRDPADCVLYSLIGDLCHLAGAFLSNQTNVQRIMALMMTALDVMHFISVTLPFCCWFNSTAERRARMLSRRRRQNVLMVCLLFGMGGCVYADVRVRHMQAVAYGSPNSRKLLNVIIQDQTELLGYVLGLLSFAISWTSRIPFFLKANKGEMSTSTHISSRCFSALAGALYASAILLYDSRLESVVKALPWILSGACCSILDVSILLISCYRSYFKWQSTGAMDSDMECLLGTVTSGLYYDKNPRKHISSWKNSSSKMPKTGNIDDRPIRKACLKVVTVPQENSAESQPLKGSEKVIRVDECYSSGSATDSSPLSSDLEWDFQDTPSQWSSQNRDEQTMDVFPLQDWTVDQRSKSNTKSSSNAFNDADLEKRMVS
ncbi:transmembrane protein 44 [Clarias gariepinus]